VAISGAIFTWARSETSAALRLALRLPEPQPRASRSERWTIVTAGGGSRLADPRAALLRAFPVTAAAAVTVSSQQLITAAAAAARRRPLGPLCCMARVSSCCFFASRKYIAPDPPGETNIPLAALAANQQQSLVRTATATASEVYVTVTAPPGCKPGDLIAIACDGAAAPVDVNIPPGVCTH
jgi:hypothetical protein